ncbi:hypothetical protein BQ8794_50254 [Mesorhizobium prunaredense]|uniref:Uncharacterized protein n=1 Tax=Mesorhizobium prunaredense TaxID=1631249 RepID=A0A1R3VFX6_9HYPH|nr:hypothetical protein BQ8794_50254 [Mesorhizobium prunaredense]
MIVVPFSDGLPRVLIEAGHRQAVGNTLLTIIVTQCSNRPIKDQKSRRFVASQRNQAATYRHNCSIPLLDS